jgi:hypothetical protein
MNMIMTSLIFDACQSVADQIHDRFAQTGQLVNQWQDSQLGVSDVTFASNSYRRAHMSVIDARSTHSLWLLHSTIFPHVPNSAPIYGFDIIAGPQKVSGAFHDFSAAGDQDHHMINWFKNRTATATWNKSRELPEWAKNIFSSGMVAIGAVRHLELQTFIELGLETLDYYLENVGYSGESVADYSQHQNYYCNNQRLNPHTPRVLVNLGFQSEQANEFVNQTLFPLITSNSNAPK